MNSINSSHPIKGYLESKQGGRKENQDFIGFADTPLGFLLVLCDGMGGGPGGRTASTLVVDTVIQYISAQKPDTDRKEAIKQAIAFADKAIVRKIQTQPELAGMGTTIVCFLMDKDSAIVAHVGDSRIYQFRFGHKVFRSADHSVVGEMVRNREITEEQARLSSNSNVITRAINGRGIAEPDIFELPYAKGDRFMLCTDGIWGAMPEKDLIKQATKNKSINATVVNMSYEVDEIGKSEGGNHDNLTLAIVEPQINSKKPIPMSKKTLQIIAALSILLLVSVISLICALFHSSSSQSELNKQIMNLRDSVTILKKDVQNQKDRIEDRDKQMDKMSDAMIKQSAAIINNSVQKEVAEKEKAEQEKEKAKAEQEKEKQDSASKATLSKATLQNKASSLKNWMDDKKYNGLISESSINDFIKDMEKDSGCSKIVKKIKEAIGKQKSDQNKIFERAVTELEKLAKQRK